MESIDRYNKIEEKKKSKEIVNKSMRDGETSQKLYIVT